MIEKIISRINEITISRSEDGIITGCNMGVCEDDDCLKCLKKKIIEIVQEVAKEYDWIPVTERLPEPFQRVLVYDAWDDSMTIEHLQENDSFIDSVVAWMPLPIAPYQKGE